MRAEIHTRIDDVPDVWEALAPPDFFFQRAFLRVMQESAVEDARFRYVVLRDGDEAAGLAVLSRFMLKLDLLSSDPWIGRLRRWLPSLLDVPMICCGVPASFGQHHLHIVRPELREDAVRSVDRCMEAWAEETRTGMLVWKEWSPVQGMCEHARAIGYAVLPTLPDHRLGLLGGTVDAFVASLRSSYRRKYRAAAALMREEGPYRAAGPLRLEERPFTPDQAEDFHRGYERVMDRTPVRLETYPPAFFRNLAASPLGARTLHLSNDENGQSLMALLIPGGPALTLGLVAKDLAHYDGGLYTVLLQCIVLRGIEGGFREVRLGQTSSYSKCSVGAQPRRLETFIRMRGTLKHRALKRLGGLLFSEVETPRLRVFKDGGSSAPASMGWCDRRVACSP